MTALYIVLGVIGFILLITAAVLAAKVTVGVSWCGDFVFSLSVGEIFRKSFTAGDIKSITSKQPEKPAVKKKEKKKKKKPAEPGESRLPLTEQLEIYKKVIAAAVKNVGKKLVIEKYVLKLRIGTEDPAACAVIYGAACGTAAELLRLVLSLRRAGGAEIYSECIPDFLSGETDVYADAALSLRVIYGAVAFLKIIRILNTDPKAKEKTK